MALSLYRLTAFCAVVDERSMSRAADRLCVSQPVVSRLVRELERHYGTPLFVRRGRAVEATDAGMLVYGYARQILQATRESEKLVGELVQGDLGVVSIALSTAIGSYTFPVVWRRFAELHPRVQLVLQLADSQRVLEQVGQGAVELGVVMTAPVPHGVIAESLGPVELVLVGPPKHALTRRRVGRAELAGGTFLCSTGGSSYENLVAALESWGILDLCRILRFGDTETVKHGVQEGLGLSILTWPAVARELASGALIPVDVDAPLPEREVLLARRDAPASAAINSFAEYVRASVDTLLGRSHVP